MNTEESRPIKKYCDYYYQVTKKEGGYGWVVYNRYKNGEVLEQSEDVSESIVAAEGDARDAISYHYI